MKTIEIEVGELDRISFSANPSTGYVWMLSNMPNCVYLYDVDDIPSPTPMPGKPGTRVYTIIGARPGAGRLEFILARPWDLDNPAQRVVYRVKVERAHIDDGPIVLYGVPLTEARARGDLAEMKDLAAKARATLDQQGDIANALAELEAEIKKAES
jgi:predicted secreted protein